MPPSIVPLARLSGAVPVLCSSLSSILILLIPLLLGACGGGGGLSSAEPVILVEGTDRFADENDDDFSDDTIGSFEENEEILEDGDDKNKMANIPTFPSINIFYWRRGFVS